MPRVYKRRDPAERLMANVEMIPFAGCWLWTGAIKKDGYGAFQVGWREQERTHRVAWQVFRGPIPSEQLVLHRCDVRSCVNPEHLFLGTNDDNMADMVAKGRSAHGERNPNAKLNAGLVAEFASSAEPATALAAQHNLHPATIRRIRKGQQWRRLTK